jgi:hypothetical protein
MAIMEKRRFVVRFLLLHEVEVDALDDVAAQKEAFKQLSRYVQSSVMKIAVDDGEFKWADLEFMKGDE